jgi:hypothetical protein
MNEVIELVPGPLFKSSCPALVAIAAKKIANPPVQSDRTTTCLNINRVYILTVLRKPSSVQALTKLGSG